MKRLSFILMLLIIVCLPASGCQPWRGATMDEQGIPKPGSDWSKNQRPKPTDELPTGTSERARDIERSLGLGR